jgi:2-iminobutanoate/2-iminopropanoate deaminase
MPRRSIDIPDFTHANPIPGLCRIGPLLVSSVIVGRDPASSNLPESPDAQYQNLFHHIGKFLEAAGADWRHVARITFFVPDIAFRDACNPVWVQHFPDPSSRPARHTQVTAGAKFASCEFIAFVDD